MDNLTHTLVGVTLGRAGLARRTPLGMAALLIGANLPDLDVLGIPFGQNLGFRRGITHGIPALLVWPFVLTGCLLAWSRWRGRGGPAGGRPIPRALLLLSFVGVWSHPLLDWFNSYGMRWLMPLQGTWYYGDTWFIIDPWVLGVLAFAHWMARAPAGGQPSARPARLALVAISAYAAAMFAGSRAGERVVRQEMAQLGFGEPAAVMVTPVAVNPFSRLVVVDDGQAYRLGTLMPGRSLRLEANAVIEKGLDGLDLKRIHQDPAGRQFLLWSRFPFARVGSVGDTTVVTLDDARYTDGRGGSFARTVVRLPPRP